MKAIVKVDLVAITPDEMKEFENMMKRASGSGYHRNDLSQSDDMINSEEEFSDHSSFAESSSSPSEISQVPQTAFTQTAISQKHFN